jgi:hypothetical protein
VSLLWRLQALVRVVENGFGVGTQNRPRLDT